ncbi:MAG: two pore domain potassium channel family protein [Gammaproteobacteria bacterium]|nr:MAG: two pore domain potassium channel family protein [Gammaproteobacteria bacterium]
MVLKLSDSENLRYLTLALLVLLFLVAVSGQTATAWGRGMMQGGFLLVLGVAMWTVRKHRWLFRSGLGALAVLALVTLVSYAFSYTGLRVAQLGLLLGLFGGLAWLAFKEVLFTAGPINSNRLLGAVSIYLLLGLIWAVVYVGILEVDPAAFRGSGGGPWLESFPEFVYFSFVSLTTLGYGDISPATPIARFVVYLEAILGQLYLAIMVAGLVGIGISDRITNRSD